MSTNAQEAKHRRQLQAIKAHIAEMKKPPEQRDSSKILPGRVLIRFRRRCHLCGRGRAVYRKFGICRICFRTLASQGMIPGVIKASW